MVIDNRFLFAPVAATLALAALCGAVCLQAETRPGAEDAVRAGQPAIVMETAPIPAGQTPAQNSAAAPGNCLKMELMQHVRDAAGGYKDTQLEWWNMPLPGTGKSSFTVGRPVRYKLDFMPRAVTNNSVFLQVRLAVPAGSGRGFRSASSTRTLTLGKAVRIVELSLDAAPAPQKPLTSGKAAGGTATRSIYYLIAKLTPAPAPAGPAPHTRPASYQDEKPSAGKQQTETPKIAYRLEMQVTRSMVDDAGKQTDTILGRPTIITLNEMPARIEVKGGDSGYKVEVTPRSEKNSAVRLVCRLEIPPTGGSETTTASYTRTVKLGKSVRLVGATDFKDPVVKAQVLAGKLVTGHGPYTAYYLDLKPLRMAK